MLLGQHFSNHIFMRHIDERYPAKSRVNTPDEGVLWYSTRVTICSTPRGIRVRAYQIVKQPIKAQSMWSIHNKLQVSSAEISQTMFHW